VGRSLALILNLTAASSLALCTASRHTPTRFYLCAAPFLHRSCCCPLSRSISHLSQTSQGCGSPASSGFKSRTLRLFRKLTSPAIVLFKTFDYYQGKSSRSFFVRLTFDARYVDGDRDVNSSRDNKLMSIRLIKRSLTPSKSFWTGISYLIAPTTTSISHTTTTGNLSHLDNFRSSAFASRRDFDSSQEISAQLLLQR
jgi:hypothetical protein